MSNEPHLTKFMSYLSLFTFFMVLLVTSSNLLQMFVGWEGVGLASYLLINFWYMRTKANIAAIKAMVMNRIGDFGLCIGFFLIYYLFKSLDYSVIFSLTPLFQSKLFFFLHYEVNIITLISIFLFIGVCGKSAQLGLHTWLPDAMEGPTPVSALIHAATMVTAGVFLLIRFSPLVEYSKVALTLISFIGALTAFFASTVAVFQNDIKKIIAYSTCSQLGYMILACGCSAYASSMFHLFNHAFFKALLFLGAGSVIHALSNEQDIRKMGILVRYLPVTYAAFLIGSLSLAGFPFLTGYYSKDLILESVYVSYSSLSLFSYILALLSAYFTTFYSLKLIYYVFLTKPNLFKNKLTYIHESDNFILIPLIMLSLLTIIVGYLFKDALVGFGTNFWSNSIYVQSFNYISYEREFLPSIIKKLPLIAFFSAFIMFCILNSFDFKYFLNSKLYVEIYYYLNQKWYFDLIYNYIMSFLLKNFSYGLCYKIIDKGILEIFGPTAFALLSFRLFKLISSLHSLLLNYYLFIAILFILFLSMTTHIFSLYVYIIYTVIAVSIIIKQSFHVSFR